MQRVENTFCFGGLLEGPLLDDSKLPKLQQWEQQTQKQGFPFHLSIDLRSYSLLPDQDFLPIPREQNLCVKVQALLNAFIDLLDPEEVERSMSTLNTSEYFPGTELQTVYALGPKGEVLTKQREKKTTTVVTKKVPLFSKFNIRRLGTIVGVFLVLLVAASPLIRTHFFKKSVNVTLNAVAFDQILSVKKTWVHEDYLVVELLVNDQLDSPEELDIAYLEETSLQRRIVLESLARKRLYAEIRDRERNLLSSGEYGMERPVSADGEEFVSPEQQFLIRIPFHPEMHSITLNP